MRFSSVAFIFLFAPLAIVIYWLLPRRWRLSWLTLANYVFYAGWDYRFCALLLGTTLGVWLATRALAQYENRSTRRAWLVLTIILALTPLAVFKYGGLLLRSINDLLGLFTHQGLPVVQLVLPLGISFYTFQALTYAVDVYYRRAKPTANLLLFACYVSMFTQVVAGPIARWRHLEGQLRELPARLQPGRLSLGLAFFAAGLVKKVLIADWLAYFVNPLWSDWRHLTPLEAWAATLGFGLQLYFDFAGYSLMALGLGHLLGLDLPQNFNSPYRARDIADFWHRWHISLSSWMRDYVFIPLGALNLRRRWGALFGTMLLAGLWHGAAWNFVLWGGYHGTLLLLHHALRERKLRFRGGWLGMGGTLLLVMLGWVLFRAPDLHVALFIYQTLFNLARFGERGGLALDFVGLLVLALLWAVFGPSMYEQTQSRQAALRPALLAALGILAAVAILVLGDSTPFLYCQF